MKKTVLFMAIFMMSTMLYGCGEKNAEDTKQNEVSTVAETIELGGTGAEETTVESTGENTGENTPIESMGENTVGDMDVLADSLTMDSMTQQVVGLDIPFIKNSGTDETAFNNFTVLFPSSEYITAYYEDGASAKLEAIDFEISIVLMNGEPNNNIREDMGESQEYIGDYVLEKAAGGNTDYVYRMTYNIVNPSCNTMLNITITVNKNRDYQEYCNALVEEFAPRFEEVILSNLK